MIKTLPGRNDPCPCGSGRKFKRCCALAPGPSVPPELAALKGGAGTPGSAPGSVRRALAVPPASRSRQREASLHLAKATRLREAGRFAESLPHLGRAASLDPENGQIHADIGTTLLACQGAEAALPSFQRAIRLDPKLSLAHLHLGLALLALGRESAALASFERAAALAPDLADAHLQRGALLHGWGMMEAAAAAFRAAAAAAESPAQALRETARALKTEDRNEEAEAALRRAKALDPADLQISELLGQLCSEQGRFAEAEKEFRSVLARDPGRSSAAFQLFQTIKACEADRPLLAELEAHAARPEHTPIGRMLLGFALGRAYEQLGDYAAAMAHFDAANAIRGAIAPLDPAMLKRDTDRLIAAFPPGSLAAEADEPEADERAVFILGLPRSGTTLVEQILSSHRAVAAGGEIGFWGQNGPDALKAGASEAILAPLAAEYRAHLDGIDPAAARITDKNPFNYIWIGLLRRALPRARIVHVRRNPIDNALSLYTTYLSNRRNYFFGNREGLVVYHENYVRLMDHWRRVLPPERFLEIDYEAVVEDREKETRRLIAFCGLPWDEACLYPEENRRAIATASLWQARQPVYKGSIGRWRNYAEWLGPLLRLAAEKERA